MPRRVMFSTLAGVADSFGRGRDVPDSGAVDGLGEAAGAQVWPTAWMLISWSRFESGSRAGQGVPSMRVYPAAVASHPSMLFRRVSRAWQVESATQAR